MSKKSRRVKRKPHRPLALKAEQVDEEEVGGARAKEKAEARSTRLEKTELTVTGHLTGLTVPFLKGLGRPRLVSVFCLLNPLTPRHPIARPLLTNTGGKYRTQ